MRNWRGRNYPDPARAQLDIPDHSIGNTAKENRTWMQRLFYTQCDIRVGFEGIPTIRKSPTEATKISALTDSGTRSSLAQQGVHAPNPAWPAFPVLGEACFGNACSCDPPPSSLSHLQSGRRRAEAREEHLSMTSATRIVAASCILGASPERNARIGQFAANRQSVVEGPEFQPRSR